MKEYINKDVIFYLSVLGNNGFYYPDLEKSRTAKEKLEVVSTNWVGGQNLLSVMIKIHNNLIPVWIKKEDLCKE